MSDPLAEYVAALAVRDQHEQAHAEYIRAYTKLADRPAAQSAAAISSAPVADQNPSPSPSSSKSIRPTTPKGKSSPAAAPEPSNLAQLRADLAYTQKSRAELETKLATVAEELSALKITGEENRKRIAQLEKLNYNLERRVKDGADELKGKGKLVESVQDEMVALNLQNNMLEQQNEKLKLDNKELTQRWMQKMEQEARLMNESNDKKWVGRKG